MLGFFVWYSKNYLLLFQPHESTRALVVALNDFQPCPSRQKIDENSIFVYLKSNSYVV